MNLMIQNYTRQPNYFKFALSAGHQNDIFGMQLR